MNIRRPILLRSFWCGLLLSFTGELQAQLIKEINFSPAEGYTDGPLFGQPAGSASVWTSVSANKGDSVFTEGEVVLSVTNAAMRIHPDASGTALGVIYWALPFPVQKKGPITVTWDWQFFPTNVIPDPYDPAGLQGTDLGFTLSDSANRLLGDDPVFAVFNELSTPNRMGNVCDARNGTGDCDGGGNWAEVGPVYKDGKLLHMRLIAYFGDESDPFNNTFDVYAQREGEEEIQTADHFYFRRCPTPETGGLNCITMWLNNGDMGTYIVVDKIRLVGPIPVVVAPTVGIERTTTGVKLTYTGKLQSADAASGPYTEVTGASSPLEIPASAQAKFYRAKN